MSEETQTTQPSLEPLDLEDNLSDIDTTMPVLPEGLYDLEIAHIGKAENKKHDGFNAVVTFKTVDRLTSTRGKEVSPGFPFKSWFPLQSHDKDTGEPTQRWKENLCSMFDAALGTTQGNRGTIKQMAQDSIGQTVRVRMIVEEDDNGIPRNAIKRYLKQS